MDFLDATLFEEMISSLSTSSFLYICRYLSNDRGTWVKANSIIVATALNIFACRSSSCRSFEEQVWICFGARVVPYFARLPTQTPGRRLRCRRWRRRRDHFSSCSLLAGHNSSDAGDGGHSEGGGGGGGSGGCRHGREEEEALFSPSYSYSSIDKIPEAQPPPDATMAAVATGPPLSFLLGPTPPSAVFHDYLRVCGMCRPRSKVNTGDARRHT